MIKKVSRKGGARSVAELMAMGEQERLELLVTSGNPLKAVMQTASPLVCKVAWSCW